jgi:uncharacterized membrane protein
MNTRYLTAFLLIPLIDAPWLYFSSFYAISMYEKIQGAAIKMSPYPAIIVYIALAYLLLQQTSVQGAFLSGAAVYAVYDFTNLTIFKEFSPYMAVADTLWGGILFASSHYILNKLYPQ